MHRSLLEILVDPVSKFPVRLADARTGQSDDILEGTLRSRDGRIYPITNGIPRFVLTDDVDQKLTEETFAFKWGQAETYGSSQMDEVSRRWLIERYGFKSPEEMAKFFGCKRRVLDAGCGSGFSTSLWMLPPWEGGMWVGVDISLAIDIARRRLGHIQNTHFVQADILALPFARGSFDAVFAEGVLHHTPSTREALRSLLAVLAPGGEVLFYVYRRKAPIREFTDDHVRAVITQLPPAEAWARLRTLTKLAKALAELHVTVDVPEDIPYLGILAGQYDVHRLVYWHFAKLFWNERFSFEENNHVNFDWYHPRYAHRHTEDEVRRWCHEASLEIRRFDVQESGITVRAVKR